MPKPMLKGTLEEKLKEVFEIKKRIDFITEVEEIRASKKLDKLIERIGDLEDDIDNHLLLNNEQIKNSVLDYCFRHFVREDYSNVFDQIPKVEEFMKQIKGLKGEKILTVCGNSLERGIISGTCKFKVKDSFRYLYVPVEQLFVLNTEKMKWDKGKKAYNPEQEKSELIGNIVYINPDIFSYSLCTVMNNRSVWRTDHSKEKYLGGSGPEESTIYLGNDYVKRGLKEKSTIKIPSTERKIPASRF